MADYIYSRVSTDGQSTDAQTQALAARYPRAQIVSEVASGAKARPMLKALVEQLGRGDVLIVAALDRLGRRTSEVLTLIEDLDRRGVVLVSVREGVDYSTITGRLVTQILVSVAEMERGLISERTKAGLEAARAKGRRGGRPRRTDPIAWEEAARLRAGGSSLRETAARVGISRSYLAAGLRVWKAS